MFRTRVARVLLVPAALLIPASIATVAFASASSAASPNAAAKAVKCKTLTGTILATGNLAGCSDTANTGGGASFPTTGASPVTIKWTSGGKTKATFSYSGGSGACAAGDTQEDVTGNVTKDTGVAKSVKIGPISGTVCVTGAGALSLAPGTKFVIG
jgi:hypothetical protein